MLSSMQVMQEVHGAEVITGRTRKLYLSSLSGYTMEEHSLELMSHLLLQDMIHISEWHMFLALMKIQVPEYVTASGSMM